MNKLLGWLGGFVGSWIGWVLGARFGIFSAFLLSVVGLALGIYLGRRLADRYS